MATGTVIDNCVAFCKEGLTTHNEYRKKHGVPDLSLNKEICDYAREWAQQCAKNGRLEHRVDNPKYGENLFYGYSSDKSMMPTARTAVSAWYDEIKEHTFGKEEVNMKTLHFTQLIWKDTKELGMGVALGKIGDVYIVANYSPKGNFVGQFVENVPKPV